MNCLETGNIINELQSDLNSIENRQIQIDELIKQLVELQNNEILNSQQQEFTQKDLNKEILQNFLEKYSLGDKSVSIKILFCQLTKNKFKQNEINQIIKKEFNGTKNFIQQLQQQNYDFILNGLTQYQKSDIQEDKEQNNDTNSLVFKEMKITRSIYSSQFDDNTKSNNLVQKQNFFKKNKSKKEQNQYYQKIEDNNSISQNNDINAPIDFRISSNSSIAEQTELNQKEYQNFSKTVGFQASKSYLKEKKPSQKLINSSIRQFQEKDIIPQQYDKAFYQFKQNFREQNVQQDMKLFIKKKQRQKSLNFDKLNKTFSQSQPQNISVTHNHLKRIPKKPPINIKRSLTKTLQNKKTQLKQINSLSNKPKKTSQENNFNLQNKKNPPYKQQTQRAKKKLNKSQTKFTPKYQKGTSVKFFQSINQTKKRSYSIKKILEKQIHNSNYFDAQNYKKTYNNFQNKSFYQKIPSIIPSIELNDVQMQNNCLESQNYFFNAELDNSKDINKQNEEILECNLDSLTHEQKRHYPQYDQTMFHNKPFQ